MVIRAACVRLSVVIVLGFATPAMAQQDPNHGHPPPPGGPPHGAPPPPGGAPPHGPPPGAIAHGGYPPPPGGNRPPPGPQYSNNYHGGGYNGGGYHGGGYNGGGYHGGGYNHYPSNPQAWQHGNWRHEWHDGRYGWWWNTGPGWYSFEAPVYPYPAYPPVLEAVPMSPPAVVVAPPPPPPAGGLPPTQFWYFCDSSRAYYPYVSDCKGPWREVPATATR